MPLAALGPSPRARGTRNARRRTRGGRYGPSPRARGTLDDARVALLGFRSIPACAGNTRSRGRPSCRPSVHPRVRGEHPYRAIRLCRFERSIPACAGNTQWPAMPRPEGTVHPRVRGEHAHLTLLYSRKPVHPRVRGEHPDICDRYAKLYGPSPRARGTLVWLSLSANTPTVHPRVRGEHLRLHSAVVASIGPSPRARGTREGVHAGVLRCRSIPACAGNTSSPACPCRHRPVHPRVRGEHVFLACQRNLSPRSIPACAGNTPDICDRYAKLYGPSPRARGTRASMSRGGCRSSVHPRVRGEHDEAQGHVSHDRGPSPRARGTLAA